ncbi:MAG: DUF484 family protein [Micavibrio sp.]|nr:DUF484 family protein [Micavibrio sp.]MBK9562758.1 DUF484 family protein [Micavibrio sp.]
MSESNLSTAPEAPMNADDIIEYLRKNPKFLQQNPEAMDLLVPPKTEAGKGVADFQNYMIQRLKADKEQVITTTREIVENSRANMNNQQRVHKAVLRLLESNNFEDFIQSITMDLATILDVDIAVFVVESNGNEIPHIHTSGVRVIPPGTVDKWMGEKNVMLQDNISGIEAIYGGGAALVKSQILLRVDISMNTPPAILAFGSRDAGMFQEGQATDQVLFLARVIERCFRSWLNLPI